MAPGVRVNRGRTLSSFCAAHGGQEKSAAVIGVTRITVVRWLDGKSVPTSDITIRRLKELGIVRLER